MPTTPQPIGAASQGRGPPLARSPFSSSFLSSSPLAQASIKRDIAECSEDDVAIFGDEDQASSSDEESEASTVRPDGPSVSMANSYRRPSFVAFGSRPTCPPHPNIAFLTKKEKHQGRKEERSLLRDNSLAPQKHPRESIFSQIFRKPSRMKSQSEEEVGGGAPSFLVSSSEESALLAHGQPETARDGFERRNRQWEESVAAGKIKTTWQREGKTLLKYASPLVVTFLLQYSLTVASIFTVGHLGKVELGAVRYEKANKKWRFAEPWAKFYSLASMTANITGYAIYQGLATSLDTLCAQAYGSGRKHLVGLQLQRMVLFLWVLTLPIGMVWLSGEKVLELIVPEKRSAELAGLYLRVLLVGAPGYALFESGKRFVQAQGLFTATTYVLLVAAPLNAFMNWLFVWKFCWGFIGAPIAVVVTDNLLPLFLFMYVYFIDGRQCWNGFTKRAFYNWGPIIKLALPGLLMVEAEFLAFEILTLAASYFSTTHLAAQSVLSTLTAITFQVPFSISIASSTRVANLIGATLSDAAKTSSKVAFTVASLVGILNVAVLFNLRGYIPQLFTDDLDVIALVERVLPLCAAFQLFDSLAATCNGILRGLGKQEVGGWVNLFCYYVVAMPISFGTAFGLGWNLEGLWLGVALALGLVAAIEGIFLYRTNWETAVADAQKRNDTA